MPFWKQKSIVFNQWRKFLHQTLNFAYINFAKIQKLPLEIQSGLPCFLEIRQHRNSLDIKFKKLVNSVACDWPRARSQRQVS